MSEHNKAVALKFVVAMGENDPQAAAECLAPDGITFAMGTTRFAGARSRDHVIGGIEAFKALMPDGLRFTVHSVTAEGERVVVEAEGNATTCDGTAYRNRYCMVFTFEDGLIKLANEYFCTKLADEVLWPLAERMQALGETQG